jgi:UDP-glucose:glycoprotein glucosyltransferase
MPSYPGQLKYIAKNIYSVVFFLDLSTKEDQGILDAIWGLVQAGIPIRFGMVPMVAEGLDSPGSQVARGIYSIVQQKGGLKKTKDFLLKVTEMSSVTLGSVKKALPSDIEFQEHKEILNEVHSLMDRFRVDPKQGALFANGKYLPKDSSWKNAMARTYFDMLDFLVEQVSVGAIKSNEDFYEFYLKQPNVFDVKSPKVFTKNTKFVNLLPSQASELVDSLSWISSGSNEETFSKSLILVDDFSSKSGLGTVLASLEYLSSQPASTTRLSLIHSGSQDLALDVLVKSKTLSELKEIVENLLKSSSLSEAFEELFDKMKVESGLVKVRKLALKSLGLQSDENALCFNGRVCFGYRQLRHTKLMIRFNR